MKFHIISNSCNLILIAFDVSPSFLIPFEQGKKIKVCFKEVHVRFSHI